MQVPDRPSNRWSFAFWVVVAGAILTAPALIFGASFGDDVYHHLLWSTLFDEQLRAGDVYPHWLFHANGGFGGPQFFVYGALPFFAASPFSLLGIDIQHQLGLAVFVALVASGAAAYRWTRMLAGPWAAKVAALFYMAIPYHINIDVYQRFAYAEFWTFVWIPLVLAGVAAIAQRRPNAIAACAIPYALLIVTHPPTTLLFSSVPLLYALFAADFTSLHERIRALISTAIAMGIGVLLGAVYLLPAIVTKNYASFDASVRPFGAYSFLPFSPIGPSLPFWFAHLANGLAVGGEYVNADAAVWSVVLSFACVTIVFAGRIAPGRRPLAAFWATIAFGALLGMSGPSLPVWNALAILQRIQFPTRLGLVIAVAQIPLVALALDNRVLRRRGIVVAGLLAVTIIATFWVPSARSIWWGYAKYGHMTDFGAALLPPEHRPAQVPPSLYTDDALIALDRATPRAAFVTGEGSVSVERWTPGGILLAVRSEAGGAIRLHQFAYPGWQVTAETPMPATLRASDLGLLEIVVPAGTHALRVERHPLPQEWIGLAISLVTLATLAGVCGVTVHRRRRATPASLAA